MTEAQPLSDLIRRAQDGDRDAFQEAVTPYIQLAYNLAFTIMRHRQDATCSVFSGVGAVGNVVRRLLGRKGSGASWSRVVTSVTTNQA